MWMAIGADWKMTLLATFGSMRDILKPPNSTHLTVVAKQLALASSVFLCCSNRIGSVQTTAWCTPGSHIKSRITWLTA